MDTDFKDILSAEIITRKRLRENFASQTKGASGNFDISLNSNELYLSRNEGPQTSEGCLKNESIVNECCEGVKFDKKKDLSGDSIQNDVTGLEQDKEILVKSVDKKRKKRSSDFVDEIRAMDTRPIVCEDISDDEKGAEARRHISLFLRRLHREQGIMLANQSESDKEIRLALIFHRQGKEVLKILDRLLYKNEIDRELVEKLADVCELSRCRKYIEANNAYMALAIGNAQWPIGLNATGIHQRSSDHRIKKATEAASKFENLGKRLQITVPSIILKMFTVF